MATVYKAYQASLDRQVAIKVMADRYASNPAFVERFRREARSIARLRHPNILTVHDAGEDNGLLYMVMEYVDGPTLREEMAGKPLPYERCASLINQVAGALNYANGQGIVHRDVKPSNVLIDKANDRAVLSDFGIAKLLDGTGEALTGTNEGMGTPEYMSPEQALGETLDGRSDEYSLAAMAFEMLAGRPPFRGDTPIAVVMGHVSKDIPSVREFNGQVSQTVEDVVRKGLAKKPAERYETIAGFNQALQAALSSAASSSNAVTQATSYKQPVPAAQPATTQWQYNQNQPASTQPVNWSQPYNQPYATPPGPRTYPVPPASKQGAPVGLLVGIGGIVLVAVAAILVILLVAGGSKNATPTPQAITTPTAAPNTTQAATTGAVTTAVTTGEATTAAPAGNLTKGGFPIEPSLKVLNVDPQTQKLFLSTISQLGPDVNLSLYTSPTSLDKLVEYYKGGPGGWAFLNDTNNGTFQYVYLTKDGKLAGFGGATITSALINSAGTPASLRPSLKEGETFVLLVDNIDPKLITNVSTTAAATTVAAATTTAAATGSGKYQAYTNINNLWQAEVPEGWQVSTSAYKTSVRDSFTQPDNVISLEISYRVDQYSTKSDTTFENYVTGYTNSTTYSDVKREKKQVGAYTAWQVTGNQKVSKGTFPFQLVIVNRKDGVFEIKQSVQSELGAQFQGTLGHLLDTLKISPDPAQLPGAALSPDGSAKFKKFSSYGGKWNAEVPDGWNTFSYIDQNSTSETWNLDSSIELGVRWSSYDFTAGDAAKLKKDVQSSIDIRKITDSTIEERKYGNYPAVLVKGKKAAFDGKINNYAFMVVSTGKGRVEVTLDVQKSVGDPYFQPVLDKIINSLQVS
jgi:serine/threonine-protein kinase